MSFPFNREHCEKLATLCHGENPQTVFAMGMFLVLLSMCEGETLQEDIDRFRRLFRGCNVEYENLLRQNWDSFRKTWKAGQCDFKKS